MKVGGIALHVRDRSFRKPLKSPVFYSCVPCTVEGNGEISVGSERTALCASYFLMWYVFQERGQAQRLNIKKSKWIFLRLQYTARHKSPLCYEITAKMNGVGCQGGDCGAGVAIGSQSRAEFLSGSSGLLVPQEVLRGPFFLTRARWCPLRPY